MNLRFFATPAEFRAWLEEHHASAQELWVGLHKKGTGRPSITWPEAVDEALCFGWIDGIRKGLDDESYANRFTPRRARSTWSAVNIARVQELTKLGRMHPAGLAAFERRTEQNSGIYSFEQTGELVLGEDFERRFREKQSAWRYFEGQPASYRKAAIWWVVSAKKEETRLRRLTALIDDSANGRPIPLLNRPKPT